MEKKVYDLRKRTYLYALEVIKFLDSLPKDYVTHNIGRQLLRSATSIGANVIEAQGSSSKKDFANFYSYALKSAYEVKFWLDLLKDSGRTTIEKTQPFLREVNELANIIASSILTLKGKR